MQVNGQPLDANRRYSVALPDYLFTGGDGFSMLPSAKALVSAAAGELVVGAWSATSRRGSASPPRWRDASQSSAGDCRTSAVSERTRPESTLLPLVYDELRRIAARYVGRERPGQTLQATALVNEAFLQLSAERTRHFQNRAHFVAIAALTMRQILVQRARARNAAKRGGGGRR